MFHLECMRFQMSVSHMMCIPWPEITIVVGLSIPPGHLIMMLAGNDGPIGCDVAHDAKASKTSVARAIKGTPRPPTPYGPPEGPAVADVQK